jgi:GT2 family glycosyltransferase
MTSPRLGRIDLVNSDRSKVPLVAISILNWNGWQDTLECLDSVRRLDYPNYLTVVVDNGSWNNSVEKIEAWAQENLGPSHVLADYAQETALQGGRPDAELALDRTPSSARMVLIRNQKNVGFSAGNNVTIHYALQRTVSADYVFLLNNDAKVDRSCLLELVSVDESSQAGIVGAVILAEDGQQIQFGGRASLVRQFFSPLVEWQLPPPELHDGFWDSFFVSGSGLLIRSDVLRSIWSVLGEYLRANLFMYSEEIMLSYDARKAGYQSVVAEKACVRHKKAASSGGVRNPIVYYYPGRNRILAAKEMLPLHWRILFHLTNVPICLAQILNGLAHGRYTSSRAVLHGIIDGYRGVSGKWKHHDREAQVRAPS